MRVRLGETGVRTAAGTLKLVTVVPSRAPGLSDLVDRVARAVARALAISHSASVALVLLGGCEPIVRESICNRRGSGVTAQFLGWQSQEHQGDQATKRSVHRRPSLCAHSPE